MQVIQHSHGVRYCYALASFLQKNTSDDHFKNVSKLQTGALEPEDKCMLHDK